MKKASNNEIKLLRKLNRRKYRDKERLFFVEGERAVEQVLENGFLDIENIFVKESYKRQASPLTNQTSSIEHRASSIEDSVFEEIADTDNPQGILALCKMPGEPDISEIVNKSGVIVATDALQDPGNMGTIIRTAAWFGAKAMIAGKGSVDIYHPKVVRSTAGATGSLPILNGELEELLPVFEKSGWETVLLDGGTDSTELSAYQSPQKTLLVVGNEANGVNERLLNVERKRVKIPNSGNKTGVESLNAAVAVSIALYSVISLQ